MQCSTAASTHTGAAANSRAVSHLQSSMCSPTVTVEPIRLSFEKPQNRRRGRSSNSNGDSNVVDGFLETGMFDCSEQELAEETASGLNEEENDAVSFSAPRPAKRTLTVYNILASAVLTGQTRLDLDKCCSVLGNCYYCPAEFPALRVDVRGTAGVFTISLFDGGRILATGGCRPVEAKRAMHKIARRLRCRLDYKPLVLKSFEIQNMLAVFDAGIAVNLRRFATTFKGAPVDYDPDRFAGARVRLLIPPIVTNKGSTDATSETRESQKTNDRVMNKLRRLLVGSNASGTSTDGSSPTRSSMMQKNGNDDSSSLEIPSYSGVGCYMMPPGARRPPPASQKARRMMGATDGNTETESNLQFDPTGRCRSTNNTPSRPEWVAANVFSTGKVSLTGARSIRSFQSVLDQILPAIGYSDFADSMNEGVGQIFNTSSFSQAS